ncbi:MAG TPA: universal stress protein [Methylomirabilota bacterium]|nr:universal stress protein [Methylomirabilota bacterium]
MAKRILVPLDRRERAEVVLPLFADLARASDATVRLLHVAPLPRFRQDTYGRVIGYADQESDRLEGDRAALSRRVPERVRREAEVAVMLLSPGRDAA